MEKLEWEPSGVIDIWEILLIYFFINISILGLVISRSMKTKKEQPQKKRDVIDRFLSILWRKEVGDLKYTTK